jgi:hypothetical protein
MPHPWQSKGLWKAGLRIWVTNSALRASSSAIKRIIQGRIARIGTNLALHASSPAIKKWQLRRGCSSAKQYHMTGIVKCSINSLNFGQHYSMILARTLDIIT